MYGVEEAGLAGENDGVQVPQCTFSLEDDHFALLQQSVNPLDNSDNMESNYMNKLWSLYQQLQDKTLPCTVTS